MRILVLIKQVPDTASRIRVNGEKTGIVTDGIKWVLNPYDEFAVEEAIRLKEQHGGEVTVASLGPKRVEETLRLTLAMGADRGVHVVEDGNLDSAQVAQCLAAVVRQEEPDLVLAGKQAVDDDAAQVGPLVSVALGWPQVMVALKLTVFPEEQRLEAERELEGAIQHVRCPLPAVVGAQRGINEPRYPTLPNIMKAKKKEIRVCSVADLGVDVGTPRVTVTEWFEPEGRPEPKILTGDPVEAAQTLVQLLRSEAKVI